MEQAHLARGGAVQFGVFELDLCAGELRKQGVKVKLQDQPFQILQILLEHPGEVVTREDLQKRIWPADTFVDFDHGISNAIKRLREALGDSADNPRYIETIPRRGYRFIGPLNGNGVATPAAEATSKAGADSAASRRGLTVGLGLGLGAAALLLALLGLMPADFWPRLSYQSRVPQIRSIAVLPLKNLSDDPAQKYFAYGMADELIADLSQISALKVISRTSSETYENTGKSLPEIARELNVDAIVEGSVQRSGNRVRITAELIYAPQDKNVWARTYERDLPDALGLQSTVASAIAEEIRIQVAPNEQERLNAPRIVNAKALDAYLQGNYHLGRLGHGFGDEEPAKAAEYFQQAIGEDPNFAQAYIGLARAHQGLLRLSPRDYEIRKAAAEKAAELDPASSDVHILLGSLHCDDWNWSQAEEEYRRALALNPNSAEAHDQFGYFLDATGRWNEGTKEFQRARELDPSYGHLEDHLSGLVGLDQAILLRKHDLERHPDDGYGHWAQYQNYVLKGMYPQAIEEMKLTARLFGHAEIAAHVDHAFVTLRYPGAARAFAADLEKLQTKGEFYMPGILAEVYSTSGDKGRALYWLEDAYQHKYSLGSDGGLLWLKGNPMYAPLRSDPRFKDLVRRVGLPQ